MRKYFLNRMIIFFFQAEDGIRDRNVTGVQTCALPISTMRRMTSARVRKEAIIILRIVGESSTTRISLIQNSFEDTKTKSHKAFSTKIHDFRHNSSFRYLRSEERRVGKECKSW